jgi:hypothetical protein
MPEVYCYTLRRAIPKFKPPDKDDWNIPGALSAAEALKYFEQDTGFRLRQIENDHEHGEFVLEQRERLPSPHGAGVQPGAVVQTLWIARAAK